VNYFIAKTTAFTIVLLTCHGCLVVPTPVQLPTPVTSVEETETKSTSSSATLRVPDCLDSLPNLSIERVRKRKPSAEVEIEADQLEEQGKGKEALDKYSEAQTLYFGELGRVTGSMLGHGDPTAITEVNISVDSPTFSFKVGRAFARNGQYLPAIGCFTESLDGRISAPNDAIAYLNRGDAYEKMGGAKDKAKTDFQQAANLFKKYKLSSYQKLSEQRLQAVTHK
jgi:tetratricopeptide (TPR) repeat protein